MNTAILYQPFDIQTHKAVFTNYLEVIIDTEGIVHYAVPSHQEWLIRQCMTRLGITEREAFYALCPKEYHYDYMTWLILQCGCIPVWQAFYLGTANKMQLEALRRLKLSGLYTGTV